MATWHGSAIAASAANLGPRHVELVSLISRLCPPRDFPSVAGRCHLIVDSQLVWAVEPEVAPGAGWIYLPQEVTARHMAGCFIITAH